jgi:hypothetical protein
MQGEYQNGGKKLSCHEFDALLADALDGVMAGQELAEFRAHAEACQNCGPLFTEAQAGMQWLRRLEPVEPPANLVHNILAATTMRAATAVVSGDVEERRSWLRRASDWVSPTIAPFFVTAMQPRYAMTAAAAFFSITMLLNFAGFRLKDLRRLDLRPSAISTSASLQYHETTAKVVKYYENMRIVYLLQSQWEQLKRNSGNEESEPEQRKDNDGGRNKRRDSREQRESQQNRNIAPMDGLTEWARLEMTETHNRREA